MCTYSYHYQDFSIEQSSSLTVDGSAVETTVCSIGGVGDGSSIGTAVGQRSSSDVGAGNGSAGQETRLGLRLRLRVGEDASHEGDGEDEEFAEHVEVLYGS